MYYRSRGHAIFDGLNMAFMVLVLVVCLFPYLHVLAKALNDSLDTALGGISIYPRSLTLSALTKPSQNG